MPITKGSATFAEITEQAEAWKNIIKVYNKHRESLIWMKKTGFNQVVFVGSGASLYLAQYACHLFRDIARMPSLVFNSSQIFSTESLPFDRRLKTLVVAISRQGESDDTNWAVSYLRRLSSEIQVLSITCSAKNSLNSLSHRQVPAIGSDDDGVLPIRSFSTILFLLSLMAGAIGGNKDFLAELSSIPKNINIRDYHDNIIKMRRLNEIKYMIFAGTGPNEALGSYGSLLNKEMSMTTSGSFDALDFRHNHFVTAHVATLYTAIMSDRMEEEELEAMRDAAKMRSLILLLADQFDEKVEASVEYSVKFATGLSPYARAFHTIPCLQLLAYQHSIAKGMNPDKPKHVVEEVRYKAVPEYIG